MARTIAAICALFLALAAALWPVAGAAQAQPWTAGTDGLRQIPPLAARVTDLTQTLSAEERQRLETKLADWEARTTNQLVVLLVPTTQPEPIEAYSLRVAEAWKIGRKGNDNGVVFLVAKNDKKMRIEVGYGLEGTLTDVTSRRIIAENVAPLFGEGKFGAGIEAGVDRIISVVGAGAPLPPRASGTAAKAGRDIDLGAALAILVIGVPVVGGILRAMLGRFFGSALGGGILGAVAWFLLGSVVLAALAALIAFIFMLFGGVGLGAGPGRGGGFSSGGWTGGGGGGFSGGGGGGFSGGGGSFGGGGASGGW